MLTFIKQLVTFLAPVAVLVGKIVIMLGMGSAIVGAAFGAWSYVRDLVPAPFLAPITAVMLIGCVSLIIRLIRGGKNA